MAKKKIIPIENPSPLNHIPASLYIYGIDFSTDVVGLGGVQADLKSGTVEYLFRDTELIDVPSCFQKYPIESRAFHIGLWVRSEFNNRRFPHICWNADAVFAYELPFVGQNTRGILPLGFAGGVAMADIVQNLSLANALDRRLVLLSPNSLKKLGTAHNMDAIFTSGNGASEKHMIAQNVQAQLNISDDEMKRITTLIRPQSEKVVNDATDALGLCWGVFLMMYALYHGIAVPKNAGEGIKRTMAQLRAEWEKVK